MTRRLTFAVVFAAVLWGGFLIAAINTLTDDLELDW